MPTPLPERFENCAFTVAEALNAGLSPGRLRGRDLVMPFPHVRIPARWLAERTTTTVSEKIEGKRRRVIAFSSAYLTRMPPHGVYSGATAGYIHGIPLPLTFLEDDGIDVSVPKGTRAPRHRGVVGHQVTATWDELTTVSGLPVTGVERTWCDLASVLDVPDLVAAGDWLIHWRALRTTKAKLAAAARQYPSMRWRNRRATALALLNDRAESPKESRLRVHLVTAGLPEPEVNVPIYDGTRRLGRVDLVYHRYKLIIEYEGEQHLTDVAQWRKDIERVNAFADLGYRTIRATAADDRDPTTLIERVRAHIASQTRGGDTYDSPTIGS